MDADKWQKLIKKQMTGIGTYRKEFDSVIDEASTLLEQRDAVFQQFVDGGSEVLVEKVSDRGAVNLVKNPLLAIWEDLNRDALAYWRDLGLTPAGLKRIDDQSMKPKKRSALAEALKALEK